jgi:prolyl-tRNA synthetase
MSNLFGRRQRESASGAESMSHDLLLRAGWVRQHTAGIYSWLAPGLRTLRRIERIVRREMDASGAQEILMPVVHSAESWKATGRWSTIDATLTRFRDRRGHDMVLGMTHEEIVAELAASEIVSYRQAGIVVYQIQTKFRDEMRPRAGLLRTREFIMKDAYSLDIDQAGLERSYAVQADAYRRIFERVDLRDVRMVRSSAGDMGGLVAHEFSALHESGEDTVGICDGCGDAANADLLGAAGDMPERAAACAICCGRIERHRAIEVGNIFQLGTRYAEALGARVAGPDGRLTPLVMGSYGIGVSRLLAVLIEQHSDGAGIARPAAVAPFDAHVLATGSTGEARAAELAAALERAGLDVLIDDRDARAGEKFADADLIGATLRIVVGSRDTGRVEIRERRTGTTHDVATEDAIEVARRVLSTS